MIASTSLSDVSCRTSLGPPTQNHKWERITLWASECAKRGVWFHPFHNNFLSAAHTSQDISDTLAVTDQAFAIVAAKFGKDQ
eukprot:SAG31_NODE_399_length_16247_cov_19.137540_3_plen_82_part_00